MKILLDTNFILTCVKQKIDLASAEEILNKKIDWIVPQDVLNELGNLKDRTGMKVEDKNAAKISFEILQLLNPEIINLPGHNPNVDMKILNYIIGKDIILATLDKDLKSRVDNRILTIRGKKRLEVI
jgi:rRNA-processing protein FCF1